MYDSKIRRWDLVYDDLVVLADVVAIAKTRLM